MEPARLRRSPLPIATTILRWVPAASWMSLLFKGSTDTLSVPHTSRFVEPFLRFLFPSISQEGLDFAHLIIRKGGHLTAYATLALLLWFALGSLPRLANGARMKFTLLFAVLYAASDEFHQSFYPSRGAALHDVLIDTAGAILALVAIHFFLRWKKAR